MKFDSNELRKLVELKYVPFHARYLDIDTYRDKSDPISMRFGGNFCFEAKKAFDLGLLKDFEINGIKSKDNSVKVEKIKEYASGCSYNRDESDSGNMDITLVYKITSNGRNIFVACETSFVFPMLLRHVVFSKNEKLLLFPYIYHVKVWADDDFKCLMKTFPNANDVFFQNENSAIDKKLFKDALFLLEQYGLDKEEERCFMNLDDSNFSSRFTINLHDLKTLNISGMYCIRPWLRH